MMTKYRVVRYSELQETWYVRADSEEEAFDKIEGEEPHDMGPIGNSQVEIEIDDSLDEAQESDLKERSWNPDVR